MAEENHISIRFAMFVKTVGVVTEFRPAAYAQTLNVSHHNALTLKQWYERGYTHLHDYNEYKYAYFRSHGKFRDDVEENRCTAFFSVMVYGNNPERISQCILAEIERQKTEELAAVEKTKELKKQLNHHE